MNKALVLSLLYAALLAAGQSNTVGAEPATPSSMGRETAVLVTLTASVEAIDQSTREVTLKGPLGNTATFTVDSAVKRLNEVKVGDLVTAEYYVSVAADVRPPTAEEEKHPITVIEGAGKAPAGASPAAGGLRRFKVVTTIEGLDRPTQTVTVKGPRGRYLTARVDDPSNLTRLNIGQSVVITYTEALAISLEKSDPKKSK